MFKTALDVSHIRNDFPILHRQVNGQDLVYLDNAATSQTPLPVIDAISDYYKHTNANIHRGVHALSQKITAYKRSTSTSPSKNSSACQCCTCP